MPRTKRINTKNNVKNDHCDDVDALIKEIDNDEKKKVLDLQREKSLCITIISKAVKDFRNTIPKEILDENIEKLMLTNANLYKSFCNDLSHNNADISHKGNSKGSHLAQLSSNDEAKLNGKRSLSHLEDSQNVQKTVKRVTNSKSKLSQKKNQKVISTHYKTPLNRHVPKVFGTVTPKIKPNTPSILLRKPQYGETVISMQGSPLMVSSSIVEKKANINIPLPDGRFIALQPEKGLCISEIPSLDSQTKHQLETLRDHLNKVCDYIKKKKD